MGNQKRREGNGGGVVGSVEGPQGVPRVRVEVTERKVDGNLSGGKTFLNGGRRGWNGTKAENIMQMQRLYTERKKRFSRFLTSGRANVFSDALSSSRESDQALGNVFTTTTSVY
jgi:hypothetical protein